VTADTCIKFNILSRYGLHFGEKSQQSRASCATICLPNLRLITIVLLRAHASCQTIPLSGIGIYWQLLVFKENARRVHGLYIVSAIFEFDRQIGLLPAGNGLLGSTRLILFETVQYWTVIVAGTLHDVHRIVSRQAACQNPGD
jgi:hypothetical protein